MDAVQSPSIVAHITERLLFRRLIDVGVDPEESMKVMAFWMWLETQDFKDLMRKISSNNDKFLALVADEAKAVLATLLPGSTTAISHNICPVTSIFSSPFSIHDICGDKETVSKGVTKIYDGVCCILFKDVLEERSRKSDVSSEEDDGARNAKTMTERVRKYGEGTSKEEAVLSAESLGPFPEGSEQTRQQSSSGSELEGVVEHVPSKLDPSAREWNPALERAPEKERCLFLTFSKGRPLTENQIINFFHRNYGPCVERVYVHRPDPNMSALFGKVVFNTRSIPAIVMAGHEQAKFSVDSKPLWCKRFELEKTGLGKKK